MSRPMQRLLFGTASLYDFGIGLVFLLLGKQLFDWAEIPHPNHWGYIQFCSLMLMIFGVMFLGIARDPLGNRNLIPFGILLKICYVGLVGFYWSTTGCPTLFKPFVFIDFLMLALFVIAYVNPSAPASKSDSMTHPQAATFD